VSTASEPPNIAQLFSDGASYVQLLEATDAITDARKMTVALYMLQRTFVAPKVPTSALVALKAEEHVFSPALSHEARALWDAVRKGWVLPARPFPPRSRRFTMMFWSITPHGREAVEAAFAGDRVRAGTFTSWWDDAEKDWRDGSRVVGFGGPDLKDWQ
jgi:hypothetical protein